MCEAVVVVDSVSNLPITINQTRVICSLEDWKRKDKEEAIKKECDKTFNDFFYWEKGRIKPKPKKERPKTSALTKKIINLVTLQDE